MSWLGIDWAMEGLVAGAKYPGQGLSIEGRVKRFSVSTTAGGFNDAAGLVQNPSATAELR